MQIGVSSLPDRTPDPSSADPGAQTSGPGFDRLVQAAQAEADRRRAIAAQSGASADQFSEQSWFAIMKAHGGEIGLGGAATAITKDQNGHLTVADATMRAKVLNYRNDPMVRSVMAVKRAADSRAVLNLELGRAPSDAEMRAAEVIGGKATAKLILTRQSTPNASAVIATPDAATANRGIYYRLDGSPQTVNDVLVKLMKPTEAAAPAQLPLPVQGTSVAGQGQTPEMALNLRARAAFSAASQPAQQASAAPKSRAAAPADLPLVGVTIANLSMPGSASGITAPTGSKLSGWRAQISGEVTRQIEHPSATVTNLPSNVTIPAPALPRPQAVMTAGAQTRQIFSDQPVSPPLADARPVASNALGPDLVSPSLSSTAYAPAASSTLPKLVAATVPAATSALPLLPIDGVTANGFSPAASPVGLQPNPAVATVADVEPVTQLPMSVPVRPSRFGPNGNAAISSAGRSLGYVASGAGPETGIPDASLAGIRPSRYFAGAAVAAQQFASLNGVQPAPLTVGTQPQPGSGSSGEPIYTMASLGPDGVPILPPVPRPAGLPPITATEALQSAGYQGTGRLPASGQQAPIGIDEILSGTKPLDLSPTSTQRPTVVSQRQRPRTIPGRF